MLNRILLIFSALYLLQSNLIAQTKDYEIFQLRFLYNEIKFEAVILQGQNLLKELNSPDKNQLVEIHKYLALSFFNVGNQDSSRTHFYSLLSINPDFEPDPVKTSPKILSFYQDIKSNFYKDNKDQIALPYKSYVFIEDIRPQAALKSLVFPGWGQLYKKQNSKAYVFGGTFLGTALVTSVTYSMERNLRDKYLDEKNPAKVDGRYDDYNNMSKTRKTMQYTAIVIWAASITDALFSDYTPTIDAGEDYLGLAVSFKF